tara:strand:- start:582 stop:1172 length:591 start_codon:yes stop_codon:yes gene_type:complete
MVPEILEISLSEWIVVDGNYGDFKAGDECSFALELLPEQVQRTQSSKPGVSFRRKGATPYPQYNFVGEVVYAGDDWYAFDAGVMAYYKSWSKEVAFKKGDWISGVAAFGVDHYSYFESYGKRAGSPALIYDWCVERIRIQTAPFVERAERVFERDQTKLGWREIAETNCYKDDGGFGEYILSCRRMNVAPRRAKTK